MKSAITQSSLQEVFDTGDVISTGSYRSQIEILTINENHVCVRPIKGKNARKLPYELLNAALEGFAEINPNDIKKTFQKTLKTHGIGTSRGGGYIYGLTRKYLSRDRRDFKSAEELDDPTFKFVEGAQKLVTVNAYERSDKARQACIDEHGTNCCVCDMNFASIYGSIGDGYIHVHHLAPIAKAGGQYSVDPIKDLRPVCPNCHSMLHTSSPPMSIEDLRSHLNRVQSSERGKAALPSS